MIFNGEECYGVVYKIQHKESGRSYVGQTVNWANRYSKYRNLYCYGQPRIYNALRKYGLDAFSFEVIYVAYDKAQLDYLESYFIEDFRCLSDGYNCNSGGNTRRHSEATKAKIGFKAKHNTTGFRFKPNHPVSADTREKLRLSQLGRKHSLERRAQRGKPVVCVNTGVVYGSAIFAREATGAHQACINDCCRGKRKSAGKLKDGTKLQWIYA